MLLGCDSGRMSIFYHQGVMEVHTFEISHRGLSGTNQMNVKLKRAGTSWMSEGIRQAQVFGIEYVPRVTPAATIAPAYLCTIA